MQISRLLLSNKEIAEILRDYRDEDMLPFEMIMKICDKFGKELSLEQTTFICSRFLVGIERGGVIINFQAFYKALTSVAAIGFKKLGQVKRGLSPSSTDESAGPLTRAGVTEESLENAGNAEIDEELIKKIGARRRSMDEEQMLDIAETCFIKMGELMRQKGRSVRGIFTKYSVPEMFPDRTLIELLSPQSFLEGVKEVGLIDLQEIEAACLMRVLAKPELENSIILNELVLIMENFGVIETMEEDDEEDYIPDTEPEENAADEADKPKAAEEEKKKEDLEPEKIDTTTKNEVKAEERKSKKKVYSLANIDAKGIKIMKKLARFLLKQYLHPREFFGKQIKKKQIKTKKNDFNLEVLKVKDFYLQIKIASVRKTLKENESLNNELALDLKTHPDVLHVKNLVRALEEIAEEEQGLMVKEEDAAKEAAMLKKVAESVGSEPATPPSELEKDSDKKLEEKKSLSAKQTSEENDLAKVLAEGGDLAGVGGKSMSDYFHA